MYGQSWRYRINTYRKHKAGHLHCKNVPFFETIFDISFGILSLCGSYFDCSGDFMQLSINRGRRIVRYQRY